MILITQQRVDTYLWGAVSLYAKGRAILEATPEKEKLSSIPLIPQMAKSDPIDHHGRTWAKRWPVKGLTV